MYIFRHWMPGLFKASQRDQGRSNCLQGLVDHLWDPRLMGNPPARKWHDDMTSWNHVSLKMTQMDGFKSFKTAICWSIWWFKLSSYPKKKPKTMGFLSFFSIHFRHLSDGKNRIHRISQAIGEDPPPHIHVSVEEVTTTQIFWWRNSLCLDLFSGNSSVNFNMCELYWIIVFFLLFGKNTGFLSLKCHVSAKLDAVGNMSFGILHV